MKFVNSLESAQTLGFIDPVRNLVVDMGSVISRIARKVAGMMKIIMNAMRDDMFKLVGKLFKVLGIAIPSLFHFPLVENNQVILDIIFCIFEKLFGPITDFISSLIDGMLGKAKPLPHLCSTKIRRIFFLSWKKCGIVVLLVLVVLIG